MRARFLTAAGLFSMLINSYWIWKRARMSLTRLQSGHQLVPYIMIPWESESMFLE